MRTTILITILFLAFTITLLCPFLLCADVQQPITPEAEGYWEKLPLPEGKNRDLHQMVMEPGGTIWIMYGGGLYYWDGERFSLPANGEFTTGTWVHSFYGGPDRGVYITMRKDKGNSFQAELYELSDGEVRYVTDFYYEGGGRYPTLYVSKAGKLYNWGSRFVAVYSKGEWKRIEAHLSLENTLIFDTGDKVHFYYNKKLYTIDADDVINAYDIATDLETVPGRSHVRGGLLGSDTMILFDYEGKELSFFDLHTFNPIDVTDISYPFEKTRFHDIFNTGDGSVWIQTSKENSAGYIFMQIAPDRKVTYIDWPENLTWDNGRFHQYPRCILNASDGSTWFGMKAGGIARYKNGDWRFYGWREGLSIGPYNYLFEDTNGGIGGATKNGVYIPYNESSVQGLRPNLALWDEYISDAFPSPIGDTKGNVWMFLKDHPGEISQWNGSSWTHIDVPFDTGKIGLIMSDDRDHIIVTIPPENRCYDISFNDIEQYGTLEESLVAAVSPGVKRFETSNVVSAGCVVLDSGKIWFCNHGSDDIHYFDGTRWDVITAPDHVIALHESPKYGILFSTWGSRLYTYDRGQFIEVENRLSKPGIWLAGPNGYQPFEKELLTSYPQRYIPFEITDNVKFYLLKYENDSETLLTGEPAIAESTFTRCDELPSGIFSVIPDYFAGFWSSGRFQIEQYRIIGCSVLQCDFNSTPLDGKQGYVGCIFEDRNHNLWINAGRYGAGYHIFMKRPGTTQLLLRGSTEPIEVKRQLRIMPESIIADGTIAKLKLFWRCKDGIWQGGDTDGSVTVRFQNEGKYVIEVIGMDSLGATTDPVAYHVNVKAPFPETELIVEGPYVIKDILWKLPAMAVPTSTDISATLTYRIDGGEWKVVDESNEMSMTGIERGKHIVEIAAEEEGEFRDPTPLRLEIDYTPDYEYIVDSRLDALMSADAKVAERAMAELKMAGPHVIPFLKEKLYEIRKMTTLINRLEKILEELRGDESAKMPMSLLPMSSSMPSSQLNITSSVMPMHAERTIKEQFEMLYTQWKGYIDEHKLISDSGISSEPYREIIKLGLPAALHIVKKIDESDSNVITTGLINALQSITRFRLSYESHGEGADRIFTVEEFPEYAGRRLPLRKYFILRWWDEYEAKTPVWFAERYAKWKKAKEVGNRAETDTAFGKIIRLGVPALPYLMDKLKEGDYDLLPAIAYLTAYKAPTKAQVTEGEAIEEEITPEKTAQDVLDWWDVNKDTWTIPRQ